MGAASSVLEENEKHFHLHGDLSSPLTTFQVSLSTDLPEIAQPFENIFFNNVSSSSSTSSVSSRTLWLQIDHESVNFLQKPGGPSLIQIPFQDISFWGSTSKTFQIGIFPPPICHNPNNFLPNSPYNFNHRKNTYDPNKVTDPISFDNSSSPNSPTSSNTARSNPGDSTSAKTMKKIYDQAIMIYFDTKEGKTIENNMLKIVKNLIVYMRSFTLSSDTFRSLLDDLYEHDVQNQLTEPTNIALKKNWKEVLLKHLDNPIQTNSPTINNSLNNSSNNLDNMKSNSKEFENSGPLSPTLPTSSASSPRSSNNDFEENFHSSSIPPPSIIPNSNINPSNIPSSPIASPPRRKLLVRQAMEILNNLSQSTRFEPSIISFECMEVGRELFKHLLFPSSAQLLVNCFQDPVEKKNFILSLDLPKNLPQYNGLVTDCSVLIPNRVV